MIFLGGAITAGALLLASGHGFVGGLVVAIASFSLLWLLSLALENASIVDVFWGPGFILLGWYYLVAVPDSPTPRGWLVCTLVTVWGLRLALHIGHRNQGTGEDFRYAAWRAEAGRRFWWISYFKVFLIQAITLWIVSSPLLLAQFDAEPVGLGPIELLGLCVWLFGLAFEAVADWQLARFKNDPSSLHGVMRSGLWSLSRHPNYFGESVLWWGIGLIALPAGGWLALVGPLMMSFLLIKVSGVAMLDAALVERKAGYAEYIEQTSSFLPIPRRRRPTERPGV